MMFGLAADGNKLQVLLSSLYILKIKIIIKVKNCCYIDVVLLCYLVYDELHKWLRNNEESLIPATPVAERNTK